MTAPAPAPIRPPNAPAAGSDAPTQVVSPADGPTQVIAPNELQQMRQRSQGRTWNAPTPQQRPYAAAVRAPYPPAPGQYPGPAGYATPPNGAYPGHTGYPGTYPSWGPPPGPRARLAGLPRWAVPAGAAAGVALVVATTIGLTSHSSTPTPTAAAPSATVSAPPSSTVVTRPLPSPASAPPRAEALPTMLLDATATSAVVGAALTADADLSGPGWFTDTADPARCAGLMAASNRNAYADAPWVHHFNKTFAGDQRMVFQGVTTFSDPFAAADFVTTQTAAWQSCSDTPIVMGSGDEHQLTWQGTAVVNDNGMLHADLTMFGSRAQRSCERALTSRGSVVVDVTACSDPDATGLAQTLARQISGRVPA